MDDSRKVMMYDANKRSAGIAYLLWFFFGWLGGHRLYAGRIISGLLLAALTLYGWYRLVFLSEGGFLALIFALIWVLIDAALIPSMIRAKNVQIAERMG